MHWLLKASCTSSLRPPHWVRPLGGAQVRGASSYLDTPTTKKGQAKKSRKTVKTKTPRRNILFLIIYSNQLAGAPVMEFPLRLVHQVTNAQGARKPVQTACEAHWEGTRGRGCWQGKQGEYDCIYVCFYSFFCSYLWVWLCVRACVCVCLCVRARAFISFFCSLFKVLFKFLFKLCLWA